MASGMPFVFLLRFKAIQRVWCADCPLMSGGVRKWDVPAIISRDSLEQHWGIMAEESEDHRKSSERENRLLRDAAERKRIAGPFGGHKSYDCRPRAEVRSRSARDAGSDPRASRGRQDQTFANDLGTS